MKILHVITSLDRGGAEKMMVKLSMRLARKHQQVVVALTGDAILGAELEGSNVSVIALGMRLGSPVSVVRGGYTIIRLMSSFRPNVVQGWMYHGNLLVGLLGCWQVITGSSADTARFWNVRQTFSSFSNEKIFTGVTIILGRFFKGFVDLVMFNSAVSLEQHCRLKYAESHKSIVIANGFETNRYKRNLSFRREIRNLWGIDEKSLVILIVARNHPMKRLEIFLEIAAEFVNLDQESRAQFVMVGEGLTDSNTNLAKKIRQLKLQEVVKLVGPSDEMPKIYCSADIFCLTSGWGEAFPNVIGEAMSTGLACLAPDIGDIKNIIGNCGFVVQVGRIDSFVECLVKLSEDEKLRDKLGEAARERIEKCFSLDEIAAKYELIYLEGTENCVV